MTIRTVNTNGVAVIEIARPEKKNALTQAMYTAMAEAHRRRRRRLRDPRAADHRPAGHLHLGQRPRGLHAAPARGRGLAGVPVHEGARRLRQAGGRGRHRRRDRHRHDDAAALRPGLRERRGAPGDAVRQPGPGAGVRVQPAGRRSAWATPRPPSCCCWASRSTARRAVEMGIANAVLPAAEVVNHARRMAERFNALPPGAVRESKALMRRGQKALVRGDDRRRGRDLRQAPAQPRGDGGVPGLLPEAQAGLLQVLTALVR